MHSTKHSPSLEFDSSLNFTLLWALIYSIGENKSWWFQSLMVSTEIILILIERVSEGSEV